jgi:Bacterial Ig-like domain (group 2)/Protein of unknown function (DUF1573)
MKKLSVLLLVCFVLVTAAVLVPQVTGRITSPTSLQLTAAPCDANFSCVPGTTAAIGQFVMITAHVIYPGTTNPTGQLCVLDGGLPINCGLRPVVNEIWFTNTLAVGIHTLTATYRDKSTGRLTSSTNTLTVSSNAASQLTASPLSLNFGNVSVGGNRSLNMALTNSGNSDVTISTVTISGPGFNAADVSGTILVPGQGTNVNATFAPSAASSVLGSIAISSNATNSQITINLSGTGVQPTVSSITLRPSNQTLPTGSQLQFMALDNFGNDIAPSVAWSSSDSSIVSITARGLATTIGEGVATISATK